MIPVNMMKPVPHICFLGCGQMAERHSKLLRKLYPSMQISFASRELNRAEKYRDKVNGFNAYGSYEDALSDPSVEIVFIVTPHAMHSELGIKAAKNGKHIIVEKPVTRSEKELVALLAEVKKNKVRFTVAENYLYKSALREIRTFIDKGFIGEPLFVEISKVNHDKVQGWRTDAKLMGGGALLEGGVHWINALRTLAGYPCDAAMAHKPGAEYNTDIPFEDSLLVVGHFGPVVGKLLHSWRIPNRLKGMSLSKVYGTEGIITFESNGLFVFLNGKKKRFRFFNPLTFLGFKRMLLSFIEDFRADRPWEPSPERIREEFFTIHAAYRSLKSGKMEPVTKVASRKKK